MKFIADFHIHSHFSIATSKKLIPEYLNYWAKLKGINVVGTGDCIHPGWMKELEEKLEFNDNGFYKLKESCTLEDPSLPKLKNLKEDTSFVLTTEISSIYKKNGKVRKVHNLCVFPNLSAAKKLQSKLDKIGNISSDGRPILGLDSKHLLEMVLESDPKSFLIPAHIWTPWFSVLGSKSGFDTIEECYEDLTPHIFALETGLSSDPPMNWACSFLDKFRLVSNSDAHSPEKLGREANIFDTTLSYDGIYHSLKNDEGFLGTIEFFPQEGKYHYDGHRKCNICWDPLETIKNQGICPVCNKPVTKGVLFRVAQLADRADVSNYQCNQTFYSITSLPDIVAEILGKKPNSKIVQRDFYHLLERLGSEFDILLNIDLQTIRKEGSPLLAESIGRLRKKYVHINEGFDGEFGRIDMFAPDELSELECDLLFRPTNPKPKKKKKTFKGSIRFDIEKFQKIYHASITDPTQKASTDESNTYENTEPQEKAIDHYTGLCMVLAGPGSGKTKVLIDRIERLIKHHHVPAKSILGITFSNKAAEEMKERLDKKISNHQVHISTFHAFGLNILKEHATLVGRNNDFYIIDLKEKQEIITNILTTQTNKKPTKNKLKKIIKVIEGHKQGFLSIIGYEAILKEYEETLLRLNAFDLEDLIFLTVQLLITNPDVLKKYHEQVNFILIDEYQDINARQYELIKLLSPGDNPNVFAIGDPDQAIYKFRGSDLKFIKQLQIDYPDLTTISLGKSYRCPSPILQAAGQILNKKKYLEGKEDNIKIHLESCTSAKSEADFIAAKIEEMIGGVRSFSINSNMSDGNSYTGINSFSDFAVLCRTSALFDEIIAAFQNHGIAYQVIGTEPFYKKEPFCSIISAFKKAYYHPQTDDSLVIELKELIRQNKPISFIFHRLSTEYQLDEEGKQQLLEFAKSFETNYADFFQSINVRHGIDDFTYQKEAVSLMTMHASKGLEFETVFIAGCEQHIIPFEVFEKKNKEDVKEEERLFYVALTRSKKYLFLSHAKKRSYKGKILSNKKSPFLNRLQKELLAAKKRKAKKTKPTDNQLKLFN